MGKVFFFALTLSIFISCGKGPTPKMLAGEVCDCYRMANQKDLSDTTREKSREDCMNKHMRAWEKVKNNNDKADEFNKTIDNCGQEMIKKRFE